MTTNFFAKSDVAPLTQFNNFVNVICPSLDLNIPSKSINSGAKSTAFWHALAKLSNSCEIV